MPLSEDQVKCTVCRWVIHVDEVITAFGECIKCQHTTINKIMGSGSRFSKTRASTRFTRKPGKKLS